mmetsp:Transcript_34274/g.69135  ORF Transcript_34274/g.69135 Transcript_34274/m.69135 type:complete len:137 (-) Transcript_34274:4001-4411(-)
MMQRKLHDMNDMYLRHVEPANRTDKMIDYEPKKNAFAEDFPRCSSLVCRYADRRRARGEDLCIFSQRGPIFSLPPASHTRNETQHFGVRSYMYLSLTNTPGIANVTLSQFNANSPSDTISIVTSSQQKLINNVSRP